MNAVASILAMWATCAGDPTPVAPLDATAPANGSVAASSQGTLACPAITRPVRDLELAFGVSGRIRGVRVKRGDRVEAGQLLAQLDGEDLAANVRLLELRANGDHEIEAAEAAWSMANDTYARVKKAFAEEAAKQREVDDAWSRAKQTFAEFELSRQRKREAAIELDAAKARYEKTRMTATFTGLVEEVRIEAGGAVDELAQVMRLVDDSAFRIDVAVPVELTLSLSVGQSLAVSYRGLLPGEMRHATVMSLAHVADAASRTRVVRLEMPNPDRMPAGVPIDVLVPAPATEVTAAAAPRE